jgi:hypothetical protein
MSHEFAQQVNLLDRYTARNNSTAVIRHEEKKPAGSFYDLLAADGITSRDLAPLYSLQNAGFTVFIHGSTITIGALSTTADIDFAIIGDLAKTSDEIKDEFTPGIEIELLEKIDYVSMSTRAENGRKISLHLENQKFRINYPTQPYALEYRSSMHLKGNEKSTYFLGGIDETGDIHAISFTCPQIFYNGGVLNYTPQTGVFYINEEKALAIDDPSLEFGFKQLAIFDGISGSPKPLATDMPKSLVIIGLELNKMFEDVPLDPLLVDQDQNERYVAQPIRKSLKLINDFTGKDPTILVYHTIQIREIMRAQKKNKLGVSEDFLEALSARLKKNV